MAPSSQELEPPQNPGRFNTANLDALTFKLGADVTPYVAIEGFYGFGIKDDDLFIDELGFSLNVKLKQYYGAHLRTHAPIGDSFDLYGLLGFAHNQIKASAFGESVKDSGGDFSYGFGANYKLQENASLFLEAISLYTKDTTDAYTIGIGVRRQF